MQRAHLKYVNLVPKTIQISLKSALLLLCGTILSLVQNSHAQKGGRQKIEAFKSLVVRKEEAQNHRHGQEKTQAG